MTIKDGGLTDTNAGCVGGMIGALVGLAGIPEYMIQTLLSFDCENIEEKGLERPDFLNLSKYVLPNILKLL